MLMLTPKNMWSVIRQKGESQNGCFKKTNHEKFSEKGTFLPPDTHTSRNT